MIWGWCRYARWFVECDGSEWIDEVDRRLTRPRESWPWPQPRPRTEIADFWSRARLRSQTVASKPGNSAKAREGQVLPFAPVVFFPLSSCVTNPIGRLGGSGGVMSSRSASNTCFNCGVIYMTNAPHRLSW
jgi:hypothetical protein